MRKLFTLLFILFFPLITFGEESIKIKAEEISYQENFILAEGKVKLEYQDIKVWADKIRLNLKKNLIQAEGDIFFQKGNQQIKCEYLLYNYQSGKGEVKKLKEGKIPPWFWKGEKLILFSPEKLLLLRGEFTTCERRPPHYHFTASQMEIYPEDRIWAKNVVFYLGKLPLFYLPFYNAPLKPKPYGLVVWAGSSNRKGVSILSHYNWYLNPCWRGRIYLDWIQKRGQGGGMDVDYYHQGKGYLYAYYFKEKEKFYTEYEEDESGAREGKDRLERWKIYAREHIVRDNQTFAFRWEKLSDPNFNRDFYFEEKKKGWDTPPLRREPETYLFWERNQPFSLAGILFRVRNNYFEEVVEEKPTFYLSLPYLPVGNSYYSLDGEISYLSTEPIGDSGARILTHQELAYPLTFAKGEFIPSLFLKTDFYSSGEKNSLKGRVTPGVKTQFSTIYRYPYSHFYYLLQPRLSLLFQPAPSIDQDNLPYYEDRDRLSREEILNLSLINLWEGEDRVLEWDLNGDWDLEEKECVAITSDLRGKISPSRYLSLYFLYSPPTENIDFLTLAINTEKDKWETRINYHFFREKKEENIGFRWKWHPSSLWNLQWENRYNIRYSFMEESRIEVEKVLHCWVGKFSLRWEKKEGRKGEFQFLISFRIRGI